MVLLNIFKIYENTKFRIFKNNKNIGLAGNTIELLKKCHTDYLLWCPDEDDVIKENIKIFQSL